MAEYKELEEWKPTKREYSIEEYFSVDRFSAGDFIILPGIYSKNLEDMDTEKLRENVIKRLKKKNYVKVVINENNEVYLLQKTKRGTIKRFFERFIDQKEIDELKDKM